MSLLNGRGQTTLPAGNIKAREGVAGAVTASKQAPVASPADNAAGKIDRYAAEPYVIEQDDREVVEAADGSDSQQQTVVIRVQTAATVKVLSVVSLMFAKSSQRVEFDYVRVRYPDGSVTETAVKGALDVPTEVMQQAPFYSDLEQRQLPVRGLREGDRLEWRARIVRTQAEAPGRFWGVQDFAGKDRVVLHESVTLKIPRAVAAIVWSPKQPVTPVEEGPYRVYRWQSSQLEPTAGTEAQAHARLRRSGF